MWTILESLSQEKSRLKITSDGYQTVPRHSLRRIESAKEPDLHRLPAQTRHHSEQRRLRSLLEAQGSELQRPILRRTYGNGTELAKAAAMLYGYLI